VGPALVASGLRLPRGAARRGDAGRDRQLARAAQAQPLRQRHAALYRQGLAEFFLDDPHRYEAAYAVPSPELQQQLLPLLRDNARAAHWHQRRYNLLAYPWARATSRATNG
jgi:hypothetical protein